MRDITLRWKEMGRPIGMCGDTAFHEGLRRPPLGASRCHHDLGLQGGQKVQIG